jgi:hypothetical protein
LNRLRLAALLAGLLVVTGVLAIPALAAAPAQGFNQLAATNPDASQGLMRLIAGNETFTQTSTTTPLTGSSTFTGSQFSTNGFGRITGTVFADQSGTVDVDQSSDGANYDYTSSFSVSASTGLAFSVEVIAPNARIRYVNGGSNQGTFRLYSFTRRI